MSYPLTYQSCITSLIEQSPITDKYYLQLADHTLLDLFKESIKNILIFNIPLQELPITKLQKQLYIIYDNTAVKQQQILEAIKDEIRQAARLQKQFLDMSYSAIEKQKQLLADMREQDNVWSTSWRVNKSNSVGETYKKSYGIAAALFCNSYHSFVSSIKDIIKLTDYLYNQCLIPQINHAELEGSLLEMVIHQFFLHYKCLDLHKVLPIMTTALKEKFVFCSDYGIDLRKKVCKYKEEDASQAGKSKQKKQNIKDVEKQAKQQSKKSKIMVLQEINARMKADLMLVSNQISEKNAQMKKITEKVILPIKSTQKFQKIASQQLALDKNFTQQKFLPVKQLHETQIVVSKRLQLQSIEAKQKVKLIETKQSSKISQTSKEVINKITSPIKQIIPIPIPKQAQTIKTKEQTENQILKIAKSMSRLNQNLQIEPSKKQKPSNLDIKNQKNYSNKKKIVKNSPAKETKRKMLQFDNLSHLKRAQLLLQNQKIFGCRTEFETIQKIGKNNGPQKITISKTNFMLNSQPCEARVTSLQFTAQNYDKIDLNLFRQLHAKRRELTPNKLQQFIRQQGFMTKQAQQADEQKEEINQQEKQVEDDNKKKKRKNKKKKNKKTQQTKNEHEGKMQKKQSTIQKPSLQKINSKKQIKNEFPMTEEQRNINNYLQCLQIDESSRIQCKVDESSLIKWRNLRATVLSSFK